MKKFDPNEKNLTKFIRHAANSHEDQNVKDITVIARLTDGKIKFSFGVTISFKCWHKSKIKHTDVAQFFWPIGTKPKTIKCLILKLAQKPNKQ